MSHRNDIKIEGIKAHDIPYLKNKALKNYRKSKDYSYPEGMYKVTLPSGHDYVFRNEDGIDYTNNDISFNGQCGIIRYKDSKLQSIGLIRGSKISADGIIIETDSKELGIELRKTNGDLFHGKIKSLEESVIKISSEMLSSKSKVYLNDLEITPQTNFSKELIFTVPEGDFNFQICHKKPRPLQGRILYTIDHKNGTEVIMQELKFSESYELQISSDNCLTWSTIYKGASHKYELKSLDKGKYHLRYSSSNNDKKGRVSEIYPLYINELSPKAPAGFDAEISNNSVTLNWGQVLGIERYELYRKNNAENDWKLIYSGRDNSFKDIVDIQKIHCSTPGIKCQDKQPIYEYKIVSVNSKGKGLHI